jgi:hypothetical protein
MFEISPIEANLISTVVEDYCEIDFVFSIDAVKDDC